MGRRVAVKAETQADRAVKLINQLTHTSGPFAGRSFDLRKWQEDQIIRPLFTTRKDGLRQYRTCLLMLPRKNGKALALDTPIATPSGWSTMGALSVGDLVFRPDGTTTPVVAATDVMLDRPCFAVEFSDGERIVADAEHEWIAYDRYRERDVRVTTREMAANWRIGNRLSHNERRYRVAITEPLVLDERDLPIHPYVLGAWLGDGSTRQAAITTVDQPVLDAIAACGERVSSYPSGGITYRVGASLRRNADKAQTLQARLRMAGLVGHKHIPPMYLRASARQRLELLQGLMDTDGSVAFSGTRRTPQCEYSTTSAELRDGVLELIRSLGLKPRVMTRTARCNGKDCGDVYRIIFTSWRDMPVLRLSRKVERLRERPSRARSLGRQVVGVSPVQSVPVRCIQVDGGMYLAGRSMVPTHNSELAAALAVYFLLFDGEIGAQVYSAAADKDQAALVFNVAAQMIRNDPELSEVCEILDSQKRIVHRKSGSFYRAISAEAYSKHGFNASVVIYDELHAAPNRELWDVLSTSQGARSQPLMMAITTAGYDRHSILWELYAHAKKVQENPSLDPTFLPILFEAPIGADWTSEKVWKKANPALGDFRSLEEMQAACARAKAIPAQENTFRRLYLNQWTEQSERWLDLAAWDASAGEVDVEALRGRPCYVGLDLSSRTDLTACVLVFPDDDDGATVLPFFFVPEENVAQRERADRVPYGQWIREGLIIPTPGNVVDQGYIREKINDLGAEFSIQSIAFDPWNATKIATELSGDGFQVVEIRQGFRSLSEPTKHLGALVASKKLRHGNHPVMRWMASNMVVQQDPAGNIKPDKGKATERIDGIVALIMGLGRAMVAEPPVSTDLQAWVV